MSIKTDISQWYVKNIIIPNFVKYDKPAFVITEQKSKYGYTYQRDLFLSEQFLADLETKIIEKYGQEGRLFLYGVGKNFGWNFCKSSNVPHLGKNDKNEIEEALSFLEQFIGATWSSGAKIGYKLINKYFEFETDEYAVCSKNGLGLMLTEGVLAGGWAWVVSDFSVEGIQTKCKGRQDSRCEVICAPYKELEKKYPGIAIFSNKIETNSTTKDYLAFNQIKQTRFSVASMKKLISNSLVKYSQGKITYHDERYFPLGIDFLFLLESQIKKLNGGSQLLFETAYAHGQRIAKKEANLSTQFMSDFMSSQGWGDMLVSSNGVGIDYYPWHELFSETKQEIFLGLLSGFMSVYKKHEVIFKIKNSSLSQGFVSLYAEVK